MKFLEKLKTAFLIIESDFGGSMENLRMDSGPFDDDDHEHNHGLLICCITLTSLFANDLYA